MSHRFLLGRGFDQPTPTSYTFSPTISANTNNYDIRAAAIADGWDGVTALTVTLTINSGVYVGSATTGGFAIDTNSSGSFPVSTSITIINNGYICGCGGNAGNGGNATSVAPSTQSTTAGGNGGNGGTAIRARLAISITNNNIIAAGGGGGGGGGAAAYAWSSSGNACEGGGGGGGSGVNQGTGGTKGTRTDTTTDLYTYTAVATNGQPGGVISGGNYGWFADCQYLALTTSSFKSTWYQAARGGSGGSGGAAGNAGIGLAGIDSVAETFSTSSGGSGGLGGYYVNGYTNVTWNATGTRLGNYTG